MVLLPGFGGAGVWISWFSGFVASWCCIWIWVWWFGWCCRHGLGGVPVSLWLMVAGFVINSVVLFLSFDFCFLLMVFGFYCCVCWGRCAGCGFCVGFVGL